MKVVKGDIVKFMDEGLFDVVVHGCNCFCIMGAGVALALKRRWPDVLIADSVTVNLGRNKLGSFSSVAVKSLVGSWVTVVNGYVQYGFGRGGVFVDYDALRKVFEGVASDFGGKRIGYPMIGAGFGGGDWGVISGIIDEVLVGFDHTLVEFGG